MPNDESILNAPVPNAPQRHDVRTGHSKWSHRTLIRRASLKARYFRLAFLLAAAGLLSACYERKDTAILNPDGSGKIVLQVQIAVAPAGEGKKADVAGTGRLFAANLINSTRGVDAWADVGIAEAPDGRAVITGTAFFPDINKLKLDLPIEFTWKRDADGATFAIQRSHAALRPSGTQPAARPTEIQVRDLVKQAQDQYKQNQPNLQVQLGAYKHDFFFQLPGTLERERLLSKNEGAISFSLDGKKVARAIDEIMANQDALSATFAAGTDGPANDDILLQSIFGQKGPVSVHVKFPNGALPVFDYRSEMRAAQLLEPQMLKDAGVQLLSTFTIKPPATATAPAATSPATRPVP
jgi:hypothetical protein